MEYITNMVSSMTKKKFEPVKEHYRHRLLLIRGPYGPHIAKFVCVDCDNTFVKWANKKEIRIYSDIHK